MILIQGKGVSKGVVKGPICFYQRAAAAAAQTSAICALGDSRKREMNGRTVYIDGETGQAAIMFPMITSVWEVRECKRARRKVMAEPDMEGVPNPAVLRALKTAADAAHKWVLLNCSAGHVCLGPPRKEDVDGLSGGLTSASAHPGKRFRPFPPACDKRY